MARKKKAKPVERKKKVAAARAPVERKRRRKVRQPRQTEAAPASVSPTAQEPMPVQTQPVTPPPVAPSTVTGTAATTQKTVRVAGNQDATGDLLTDAQLAVAKTKFSYGTLAEALVIKSNRGLRVICDSLKKRAKAQNLGKSKRMKKAEETALLATFKVPGDVDKWISAEMH